MSIDSVSRTDPQLVFEEGKMSIMLSLVSLFSPKKIE